MGNSYIIHYASKYYDPQKAHEYYEKHKQLVGRRSTAQLNDKGKEIWSYTKKSITDAKKQDLEKVQKNYSNTTTDLREKAKQTREAITKKLSELIKAISEEDKQQKKNISEAAKSDRETIKNSKEARIKQLMNTAIPKNISKAEKAKLIAAIREESDRSNESVKARSASEREAVSKESTQQKETGRKNSTAEREKVAADLKSALANAKKAFEDSKNAINGQYENTYQNEYDSIKSSYRKVTKTRR